ncbi:MAG: hypothetical protein R2792_11100 [Saprospiraceae bacterium]
MVGFAHFSLPQIAVIFSPPLDYVFYFPLCLLFLALPGIGLAQDINQIIAAPTN